MLVPSFYELFILSSSFFYFNSTNQIKASSLTDVHSENTSCNIHI